MSEPAPALETPTEIIPPVADAATGTIPISSPPPAIVAEATETVTCPECGTVATVTMNRRESRDFCRNCDYPLFWTPSAVLRDSGLTSADDSLRRLPGTVGRATLAAVRCPHCSEPNTLSAVTCVRCGLPMHVEAPPPPPQPVYVPPPPEPVYVEPEQHTRWWLWLVFALSAAAMIVLVVLAATGTFS